MSDHKGHFALICHDGADGKSKREKHLAAHLRFVEGELARKKIAVAGPLYGADGQFTGSLFVVRAADVDGARDWLGGDPYFQAGLWQSVDAKPFKPVAGDWVGGKTW